MSKSVLGRLLKEPLLHFFLIGIVLFAAYPLRNDAPSRGESHRIVITGDDVDRLVAEFVKTWSRPPTLSERDGMIASRVRNEVYYREALALGLDQNDPVIRQRLQQKMEFLTSAGSDLSAPDDAELQAWLDSKADMYRLPPRIALEQVFLGNSASPVDVTATLAALKSPGANDPETLGQPTLLPGALDLSRQQAVDGTFGLGFFAELEKLPLGEWSGPVESGYGLHLVRVTEYEPGAAARLEDIRDIVLRDWLAEKSAQAREAEFERLRARYAVEVEGAPAPEVARP